MEKVKQAQSVTPCIECEGIPCACDLMEVLFSGETPGPFYPYAEVLIEEVRQMVPGVTDPKREEVPSAGEWDSECDPHYLESYTCLTWVRGDCEVVIDVGCGWAFVRLRVDEATPLDLNNKGEILQAFADYLKESRMRPVTCS